jgi:hypothetical protein
MNLFHMSLLSPAARALFCPPPPPLLLPLLLFFIHTGIPGMATLGPCPR